MKRIIYTITMATLAVLLSTSVASAQESTGTKVTDEKAKQKEAEAQKKAQAEATLKKAEEEKNLQIKEKQLQEKMVQEKMLKENEMELQKHLEAEKATRAYVIQRDGRDLERIRERAEELSRDAIFINPEEGIYKIAIPSTEDYFIYNDLLEDSKSGTSWNYSRQVLEASFTNEFTMDAGEDETDVNISVSGNCAEGSISVTIILPDGKQLSEIVIDANGSLNWRKSFETDEEDGWKNGNWIFRINAKNATGNFRISMSAY